jgi:hypothetical protein
MSLDYTLIEEMRVITCGTTGQPTAAEGTRIALKCEFRFESESGVAYDSSDADHKLLMNYIVEVEFRDAMISRHSMTSSRSTPYGSNTFPAQPLSFTWSQYDALVRKIRKSITRSDLRWSSL